MLRESLRPPHLLPASRLQQQLQRRLRQRCHLWSRKRSQRVVTSRNRRPSSLPKRRERSPNSVPRLLLLRRQMRSKRRRQRIKRRRRSSGKWSLLHPRTQMKSVAEGWRSCNRTTSRHNFSHKRINCDPPFQILKKTHLALESMY